MAAARFESPPVSRRRRGPNVRANLQVGPISVRQAAQPRLAVRTAEARHIVVAGPDVDGQVAVGEPAPRYSGSHPTRRRRVADREPLVFQPRRYRGKILGRRRELIAELRGREELSCVRASRRRDRERERRRAAAAAPRQLHTEDDRITSIRGARAIGRLRPRRHASRQRGAQGRCSQQGDERDADDRHNSPCEERSSDDRLHRSRFFPHEPLLVPRRFSECQYRSEEIVAGARGDSQKPRKPSVSY